MPCTRNCPSADRTWTPRNQHICVRLVVNWRELTVYTLEKDVEDAMAGYSKFVLVEETVLDSLLVVLVRVEIILKQVVQES
jgi:hypothetical protein